MRLVHDLLRERAAAAPDRVALRAGGAILSFLEFDLDSDRFACRLQAEGIARGDRVAIVLDNGLDFLVALVGTLKAGAVAVPASPALKPDQLSVILNDCTASCVVAGARRAAALHAERGGMPSVRVVVGSEMEVQAPSPGLVTMASMRADNHALPADPSLIDQDLSAIIYTSGSTGRPKGVMLTHANVRNTAWATASYLHNSADDVVLCGLPLSHTYALFQFFSALEVGYELVLERSFAYPADTARRLIETHVTGLPAVPGVFAALMQLDNFTAQELPSLRYVTNAAAPFPPAQIRALQERFPGLEVFSMYGLTECTRVSFMDPALLAENSASVGKAMPNCEAYVGDAEGRRLGPGEIGELHVRGANVMRGYWQRPEATARALIDGDIPGEKILRTGDLFRTDEEGYLYFVGRTDDVFKCRGEKVSPRDIENVLHEIDGVLEAAVIGVDDARDGKAVKACIVLVDGMQLDVNIVRRHCRRVLASHMVPKMIEFMDRLPKTESGKIKKSELV